MKVMCLYANASTEKLKKLAEYCLRFSPRVCMGKSAVFVEVGKSAHLFSDETLVMRARILSQRLGLQTKVAIAASLPASLVKAKYQKEDLGALDLSTITDWLDPLGMGAFSVAQVQRLISTLRALGMSRIQDLYHHHRSEFQSRFGAISEVLWEHLMNGENFVWSTLQFDEVITESHHYSPEDGCMNLEPILFQLKPLLERIGQRLYSRGNRATAISLEMDCETYSVTLETSRKWLFEFPLPQHSALSMLSIIRDKLSYTLQSKPLLSPVNQIRVTVMETAPGAVEQKHFFESNMEQEEGWNSLVSRISQKIGKTRVFKAQVNQKYIPEKSWDRVVAKFDLSETELELPYPERPLELLSEPRLLARVGRFLILENVRHEIVAWSEQERIDQHWWSNENLVHRQYYKIRTAAGIELWIFRSGQDGKLYLHGIF